MATIKTTKLTEGDVDAIATTLMSGNTVTVDDVVSHKDTMSILSKLTSIIKSKVSSSSIMYNMSRRQLILM